MSLFLQRLEYFLLAGWKVLGYFWSCSGFASTERRVEIVLVGLLKAEVARWAVVIAPDCLLLLPAVFVSVLKLTFPSPALK